MFPAKAVILVELVVAACSGNCEAPIDPRWVNLFLGASTKQVFQTSLGIAMDFVSFKRSALQSSDRQFLRIV
jgi:hypothetical protein